MYVFGIMPSQEKNATASDKIKILIEYSREYISHVI